jgi:hypothetical protein
VEKSHLAAGILTIVLVFGGLTVLIGPEILVFLMGQQEQSVGEDIEELNSETRCDNIDASITKSG